MWPVIIRELRAGSRQWTTYGLRVLAAAAVIAGALSAWIDNQTVFNQGAPFFTRLHQVLLVSIWILVPMMASDCISREKREGTLGLLFLTPLKPRDIVLAKAAVHALRALTLWAAAIPIVSVAFLLGGVQWQHVVISSLVNFSALWFALAAAVLASAVSTHWLRALALSMALAGVALIVFALLNCATVASRWGIDFDLSVRTVAVGFLVTMNFDDTWSGSGEMLVATTAIAGLSFLFAYLVLLFAARITRARWQDKPKSKEQVELERVLFTPRFLVKFFRRWMKRTMDRNPIGWLEQRSWSGRMTAWVWLAIMISFSSVLTTQVAILIRDGLAAFYVLAWLLLGTVGFISVGSFRREQENRVLELILVTPLKPHEIILGRLRGLWMQFLPSLVVWTAIIAFLASVIPDLEVNMRLLALIIVGFIGLPVAGAYFSLSVKNVVLAWLAALAVTVAAPLLVGSVITNLGHAPGPLLGSSTPIVLLVEIAIICFLGWRLHARLVSRTFPFHQ